MKKTDIIPSLSKSVQIHQSQTGSNNPTTCKVKNDPVRLNHGTPRKQMAEMKTAVLYNLAEKPTSNKIALPENWRHIVRRFSDSYKNYQSGHAHDLIICTSGAEISNESRELLGDLRYTSFPYFGFGWDVGAYQFAASKLKGYQRVMFLNSQAHICCDNWLKRFAEAWDIHGEGIYGASSSFEIAPHIRTCAIMTSPRLIAEYPYRIRSRYDASLFENSPKNFSLWAAFRGIPVYVVLKNHCISLFLSRSQEGTFRSGDQQELLIQDRHSLMYEQASEDERAEARLRASGESGRVFEFVPNWKRPFLPFYERFFY